MNEQDPFSWTQISKINGICVKWTHNSWCNLCKQILDSWKYSKLQLELIWWTWLNTSKKQKKNTKTLENSKNLKRNENKNKKNLKEYEKRRKRNLTLWMRRKSSEPLKRKRLKTGRIKEIRHIKISFSKMPSTFTIKLLLAIPQN